MLNIMASRISGKLNRCVFVLCLALLFINCSSGGSGTNQASPSSAKAITAFSFTAANNPGLSANATGTINGTNISVTLPYGISRTALVATFSTTGQTVSVNNTDQTSGLTSNDFTNAVIYVVTAEDETTQSYTVTVINASNSAKDITAFSFTVANNPGLSANVAGTISGTSIYLTVPNGTNRTALVATFSTTGQTVRIGSTQQVSGTTPNDFTASKTYVVTAQDASTKTYLVTVIEAAAPTGAIIAGHLAVTGFNDIPETAITEAKTDLHIAYGHTSHGSQIITGMNALASANSLYAWNNGGTGGALDLHDYAMGGDVGYYPDWVDNTRAYLGAPDASTGRGTTNPDVNVIIWSWCGQAASQTQQSMIDYYLAPMSQLEADYPGIKFVYMTGHLDGSGATGNLHLRNQQIRDYCITNNKILFDFADIESYDPSGNEFMTRYADDNCDYDNGNWATEWITANPADTLTTLATNCGSCAHSQRLNCVMKGRAVWWLWAILAGWNP